jgi:hypothetical protein
MSAPQPTFVCAHCRRPSAFAFEIVSHPTAPHVCLVCLLRRQDALSRRWGSSVDPFEVSDRVDAPGVLGGDSSKP